MAVKTLGIAIPIQGRATLKVDVEGASIRRKTAMYPIPANRPGLVVGTNVKCQIPLALKNTREREIVLVEYKGGIRGKVGLAINSDDTVVQECPL